MTWRDFQRLERVAEVRDTFISYHLWPDLQVLEQVGLEDQAAAAF